MLDFRRRHLLVASAALATSACAPTLRKANERSSKTQWRVGTSIGLDACFAIAIVAASNNVLQVRHHAEKKAALSSALGPKAVEASLRLVRVLSQTGRINTPGPALALIASAGPVDDIDCIVHTLVTPGVLQSGFQETLFWQGQKNQADLVKIQPFAADAFVELKNSNFESWWQTTQRPSLEISANSLVNELANVDITSELRRFLGRSIEAQIAVFVSALTEPHGVRIAGQQFITSPNWSTAIVRRNAVHEMIHPFLDPSRPESSRIIAMLGKTQVVKSVIAKSNPEFGYSSTQGIIEEGATQALEAIINERLGQARDSAEYWRRQDGGMHILAAALHEGMHRTGFSRSGGDALSWLQKELTLGNFQDNSIRELATRVVGASHVDSWLD